MMAAEVIPSLAMEPHVRTINGYQAACLLHPHDGDAYVIGDRLEEGVWLGEWHEKWIDARIDAVAHDMVKHPRSKITVPFAAWWQG